MTSYYFSNFMYIFIQEQLLQQIGYSRGYEGLSGQERSKLISLKYIVYDNRINVRVNVPFLSKKRIVNFKMKLISLQICT